MKDLNRDDRYYTFSLAVSFSDSSGILADWRVIISLGRVHCDTCPSNRSNNSLVVIFLLSLKSAGYGLDVQFESIPSYYNICI